MSGNHDNIQRALGDLEGAMREGFKGIHSRLDILNGSVEKHDEKINDLETFRDTSKGKMAIIATAFGTLSALIVAYFKNLFNL